MQERSLPSYSSFAKPETALPEPAHKMPKRKHRLKNRATAAACSIIFGAASIANSAITQSLWPPKNSATIQEITPIEANLQEGGTVFIKGKRAQINLLQPPPQEPSVSKKERMHTGIFVLGGLGTIDSQRYAVAESPAFVLFGRLFSVGYPTDMNIKTIADAINATVVKKDLTTIYLDGASTGGVVALRTLPFIHQHDLKINLIFDDTPILPSDIRDQNYRIPILLYNLGLRNGGGSAGKLLGELITNLWSNPNANPRFADILQQAGQQFDPSATPVFLNLFGQLYTHIYDNPNIVDYLSRQLSYAWEITNDPTPPGTWLRQLNLDATNTMRGTIEDLASKHITSIIFIHPANWRFDETVRDMHAAQQIRWASEQAIRIQRKAREAGLPVSAIPVPVYVNETLPGKVGHQSAIEHPTISIVMD